MDVLDIDNEVERSLQLSSYQAESLRAAQAVQDVKKIVGVNIHVKRIKEGQNWFYAWQLSEFVDR
jgi:hypothetical protein